MANWFKQHSGKDLSNSCYENTSFDIYDDTEEAKSLPKQTTEKEHLDNVKSNNTANYVYFIGHSSDDSGSVCSNSMQASTKVKMDYSYTKNQMSKQRLLKNLFLISCVFLLHFAAVLGFFNLQSTMNAQDKIGVTSLIVNFTSLTLSIMFLPSLMINRLGCKKTFLIGISACSLYIASNFYLHWATFIPTAVLMGFAAGTLWACNCTYVTKIGYMYASCTEQPPEIIIARFFGIFYVFFETTQIWSSLISYYVLKPTIGTEVALSNETQILCGADFCNQESSSINNTNSNLDPPDDEKRYLITGIFLGFMVLAFSITLLFIDPLDRQNGSKEKKQISSIKLILASAKHLKKPNQLLLVPVTIFAGVQQGFYMTTYTEAFIACVWGVHHVGYVTICFGIVSSVTSCLLGPMVKCFSRAPVVLLAATGNTITSIYMLLWTPTADEPVVLFVIAGVWGFGDAIWWVLLDAAYGVLFENDEEAAFSNFYFWNSIGFILMFICSNYLCVPVTIYILLSCLFVGIAGYLTVEMKSFCGKKCKYDMDKGS